MPKFSSLLATAALFALAACHPAPTASTFVLPPVAKVQKDMPPEPQITSAEDQMLLAFNEIGFARRSAQFAINPPSLQTQDGCIIRYPFHSGRRLMNESIACSRTSDSSDKFAGQVITLEGSQYTDLTTGLFDIDGTFNRHVYEGSAKGAVAAVGHIHRREQLTSASGANGTPAFDDQTLTSNVYALTQKTSYLAEVADGSTNQAETWTAVVKGGVQVTPGLPLTMLTGAITTLVYFPEEAKDQARPSQLLTLTAKSDISFALKGDCLRPVGSFSYSLAQSSGTTTGTLVSTVDGYQIAGEKTGHSWGLRCLER